MNSIHEEDGLHPSDRVEQLGLAGEQVEKSPGPVARSAVRRAEITRIAKELSELIDRTAGPPERHASFAEEMGALVGAIERTFSREISALRFDLNELLERRAGGEK